MNKISANLVQYEGRTTRPNTCDLFAIVFFGCGWVALLLYLSKVFYLDEEENSDKPDEGFMIRRNYHSCRK